MIEPGQAPPAGEELRSTKNVQVIDGAMNCTYSIYAFTDEQFALLFPEEGQDVEFIEDAWKRLSKKQRKRAFSGAWTRPVRKPDAQGIHGTLFYGLDYKKELTVKWREPSRASISTAAGTLDRVFCAPIRSKICGLRGSPRDVRKVHTDP